MNNSAEDIGRALDGLTSADLETRVMAVEDLARLTNDVAGRVVAAFEEERESRYLFFERLGRFGTAVIKPLEDVLNRSQDPDVRILAAAALLDDGSKVGLDELLQAVSGGNDFTCLAARVLARASVSQARPVIEDALLTCDLSETTVIECLVDALRQLGATPVSGELRARLQALEPEWLRKSVLA